MAILNSDGSPAGIKAQLALASPGDTITLPPGPITWTTALNISAAETKAVTIQGAGPQTGGTVITMSVAPNTANIINWVIKAGPALPAAPLVTTLKGIYFKHDPNRPFGPPQFRIIAAGDNRDNSRFHWTDCRVDHIGEIWLEDWIGLVDHCDFINKVAGVGISTGGPTLRPFHSKWEGGTNAHKSWSEAIDWSSDNFIYIEDCSFYYDGNSTGAVGLNGSSTGFGPTGGVGSNNTSASNTGGLGIFGGVTDATSGARVVVRNCQLFRAALNTHGTDTGNLPSGTRGCVAYGKFNNKMYSMRDGRGSCRSGIELAHGNREFTANGHVLNGAWPNQSYRSMWWNMEYKSAVDGANGGEITNGYTFDHNDNVVHKSGQVTSGVTAVTGVYHCSRVFVNQTLTPGQFAENPAHDRSYVIVNTSIPHVADPGPAGSTNTMATWTACIVDNGADYIDFQTSPTTFRVAPLDFTSGQNFEVRGVYSALDGPGMHGVPGSTFMSGSYKYTGGVNFTCNNANDQTILGNYYWDNKCCKFDGTPVDDVLADNASITTSVEGKHFFNSQPSPTYFLPYDYPHVLNPNAGATFDITGTTGFTAGATATCTDPVVNCCKIATRNFTAGDAGSISLVSWDSAVSNINFTYLGSGTATISGSASGTAGGPHTALIRGTNPTTDKSITIFVSAPNDPPSTPVITSPLTGGSYAITTPILISVNSTDPENQMDRIEFYSDSVLIGSSSVGSPYQMSWGQGSSPVPLTNGGHTLTAKAYDNVGNMTASTSSVNITVTAGPPPPPSPALVVVIN